MSTDSKQAFVRFGNLTRADGSAIYVRENTVIQTAVYGPADIPFHKENPEKATVEVVYKRAAFSKDITPEILDIQKSIQLILEQILYPEDHPRSSITVIIQELDTDGSVLASAINSVCCAILDSCIAMKCFVAAICVVVNEQEEPVVNPNAKECEDAKSQFTIVYDSTSLNIISVLTKGTFSTKQFKDCLKLAKQSAAEECQLIRNAVKEQSIL